jgi:hypothetical protein
LAVFQTRPGIVEQSEGVVPLSLPDEPELLVEPELEEVEPLLEELLVEAPEPLLVELPELLLVEPELEVLLPEPELLLIDPELPLEEPDPPEDPELDAPPSPVSIEGALVPPHAPTALRGIETARHTNRNRVCIGVLRQMAAPHANLVPPGSSGLFSTAGAGVAAGLRACATTPEHFAETCS